MNLPSERGITDHRNHPVIAYYCSKAWQGAASRLPRGLFQGTYERLHFVLASVDMVDLHARPLPPQRSNQGADHCIPTASNRGKSAPPV